MGYSGDGRTCSGKEIFIVHYIHFKSAFMLLDVNECSGGSNPCDPNAMCTNTDGSFTCACMDGFTGDGDSCAGEKLSFKHIHVHILYPSMQILMNAVLIHLSVILMQTA